MIPKKKKLTNLTQLARIKTELTCSLTLSLLTSLALEGPFQHEIINHASLLHRLVSFSRVKDVAHPTIQFSGPSLALLYRLLKSASMTNVRQLLKSGLAEEVILHLCVRDERDKTVRTALLWILRLFLVNFRKYPEGRNLRGLAEEEGLTDIVLGHVVEGQTRKDDCLLLQEAGEPLWLIKKEKPKKRAHQPVQQEIVPPRREDNEVNAVVEREDEDPEDEEEDARRERAREHHLQRIQTHQIEQEAERQAEREAELVQEAASTSSLIHAEEPSITEQEQPIENAEQQNPSTSQSIPTTTEKTEEAEASENLDIDISLLDLVELTSTPAKEETEDNSGKVKTNQMNFARDEDLYDEF